MCSMLKYFLTSTLLLILIKRSMFCGIRIVAKNFLLLFLLFNNITRKCPLLGTNGKGWDGSTINGVNIG